jgi:hypothetical protein
MIYLPVTMNNGEKESGAKDQVIDVLVIFVVFI